MRIIVISLFLLIFISLRSQQLKFIVCGDIMGHGPQIRAAYDSSKDSYDYEPCFRFVKPYIQNADVAIANLEVVLGDKPYTGYPVFSSPDDLATGIKNTGFDILLTANNHCYDKGKFGFERTIHMLDSFGIAHLGTYINPSIRDSLHPYIFEKNGIRIALLNYTYSTNGIVPEKPNVVNYIEKERIAQEIRKAKSQNADCILAIMHWGAEYMLTPNNEQKELALFLAQQGCHAIIGSHPHVVQTFEYVYPNSLDSSLRIPVFYSMGNFISNQRNRYRDGGAMFTFYVEKNSQYTVVKECKYIPYWVYKGILQNKYQYYILPLQHFMNVPALFPIATSDKDSLLRYANDVKVQLPKLEQDTLTY